MTPAASLQSHVLRLTNRSEDLDSLSVTLCCLCLSYLWPSVSLSLWNQLWFISPSYVTLIWCFLSINSNNLRGVTSSMHVTYMWTLKLSLLAIWSDIIFQRDMMSEYQRYSSWAELSATVKDKKDTKMERSPEQLRWFDDGVQENQLSQKPDEKTVTKCFY